MDDMKQEFSGTKLEIIGEESESECLLWEGEVQLRLSENEKDIVAPLTIRQKDNCKDGSRLFDWTSGKATAEDFSLIYFRRISCSSNQTSYECTWRKIATWT